MKIKSMIKFMAISIGATIAAPLLTLALSALSVLVIVLVIPIVAMLELRDRLLKPYRWTVSKMEAMMDETF